MVPAGCPGLEGWASARPVPSVQWTKGTVVEYPALAGSQWCELGAVACASSFCTGRSGPCPQLIAAHRCNPVQMAVLQVHTAALRTSMPLSWSSSGRGA